MSIHVQCACGRSLKAPEAFRGKRGQCPSCARTVTIPILAEPLPLAATSPRGEAASPARETVAPPTAPPVVREMQQAIEVKEFLDPPTAPIPHSEETLWARRMFEALLDPRSIQWVLTIGGGLMVLGLLVWLISLGIFKNPVVVAAVLSQLRQLST